MKSLIILVSIVFSGIAHAKSFRCEVVKILTDYQRDAEKAPRYIQIDLESQKTVFLIPPDGHIYQDWHTYTFTHIITHKEQNSIGYTLAFKNDISWPYLSDYFTFSLSKPMEKLSSFTIHGTLNGWWGGSYEPDTASVSGEWRCKFLDAKL